MLRKVIIFAVLLVVVILGVAVIFPETLNAPTESPTQSPTSLPSGSIQCKPEQRGEKICTALYAPVCATVNVQCIKAPCDPVRQTFGNSCEACANPLVHSYTQGECK